MRAGSLDSTFCGSSTNPRPLALAYGLDRKQTGKVAVYDLGGGTFDCSILSLTEGVFRVLSTNGDTFLGGDDFDRAIMEVVAMDMSADLDKRDPELLQHLRDQAEKTKIALSSEESVEFRLDTPRWNYRRTFTRTDLESLIAPMIDRSLQKCHAALLDAELTPANIDEVVLVGGSTRIPYVRKRVGEFFGRTAAYRIEPGRSRRDGGRFTSRHPHRPPPGFAALGCHPAFSGDRNPGRGCGQDHPPELADPLQAATSAI